MMLLTIDEIVRIHQKIIKATGGSPELRDKGLLESAIYSTEASFDDIEIYPSAEEKAARLSYAIINNHSFVDGNKRIGIVVMLITLQLNNVNIQYSQKELIYLGVQIASGDINYNQIFQWIKEHRI